MPSLDGLRSVHSSLKSVWVASKRGGIGEFIMQKRYPPLPICHAAEVSVTH